MSSLSFKKVFVTGANGFVGEHLVQELCQRGYQVRCLIRKTANRKRLESLGVELFEGSLDQEDVLTAGIAGASLVFHVAGRTHASSLSEFRQVNQKGCRTIAKASLAAAARTGTIPKLVFVSSLAAAGPAPHWQKEDNGFSVDHHTESMSRPTRETDLPRPYSGYGISKWEGEKELALHADQLPITIVRPSIVFGPHDTLSAPLFKMAQKGIFWIPGYFDQEFSFIYVADLVQLLIAAGEQGEHLTTSSLDEIGTTGRCSGQGIYFAAHPERLRFSEFGKSLGRAMGRSKVWTPHCPPAGVLIGGLVMEGLKKILRRNFSFDWNKAKESLWGPWICDVEKSQCQLGSSFPLPLEMQFKTTADSYIEQGVLKRTH